MSPDFWWGALAGVATLVVLFVVAVVVLAFALMRGAEMAQPRVHTGIDEEAEQFLRDLNQQQ